MPVEIPKRLFLIDAMGYIFRAFYAPMPMRMRTATGIPTNVPYVFANMIRKLLKDWKPDYLGVVFDVSAPTFRDELFAAYKAKRQPMPDDLALQVPYVRRYCEAMRLPMLEYPGYEADDVIGTLSKQAEKEDLDVYVVTSDKDLMQLVGGRVRMLNPAKGDLLIDAKKVEELMGVPPSQVADVMALMGDTIDNIPGARDPNEKPAPGERLRRGGNLPCNGALLVSTKAHDGESRARRSGFALPKLHAFWRAWREGRFSLPARAHSSRGSRKARPASAL